MAHNLLFGKGVFLHVLCLANQNHFHINGCAPEGKNISEMVNPLKTHIVLNLFHELCSEFAFMAAVVSSRDFTSHLGI